MKPLAKALSSILYLAPRVMLFGIFALCLFLTAFVSFDFLVPNDNLLEDLLARTIHGVRDFTFGETANKKDPHGGPRQNHESFAYPKTSG